MIDAARRAGEQAVRTKLNTASKRMRDTVDLLVSVLIRYAVMVCFTGDG